MLRETRGASVVDGGRSLMPKKTPNQLLNSVREIVKQAREDGENGIASPDRFYEKVEEVLVQLDESCKSGLLPDEWRTREEAAKRVLSEGLSYHEHDGHNMPKSVAREALETLGVPREEQP